ncbi:DUF362 domain-containing protein [Candidatus Daviesbacteria bacterium]|nr:DUF362 domain-containing protein [Candidatus Daviesbacteria bacterium]
MSTVYIKNISPKTVLEDYQKLLHQAHYLQAFDRTVPIVIKINLSWTRFYPACSTPPWQLEGVLKTLIEDGVKPKDIIPVENRTVVTNVIKGSQNNKWLPILKKYGVKMHYLTDEPYVDYKPKSPMLVMGNVFHKISLPKIIIGKNMLHLPTMKMHVFTTTTGGMKNYFGMLRTTRHYAHRNIHETLVDLLSIQKEVHPGIFGVMDGAVVGKGSGPRAMEWEIKNYLLASADLVALDATAAKMMGFNPLQLDYLKLAQKQNLGTADPKKIKVVGSDISKVNWHYKRRDTLASRGQKLIYHHSPLWVEKMLLQSAVVPWSYFASNFYHDRYWWNRFGRWRVNKFLKSDWGRLFEQYKS